LLNPILSLDVCPSGHLAGPGSGFIRLASTSAPPYAGEASAAFRAFPLPSLLLPFRAPPVSSRCPIGIRNCIAGALGVWKGFWDQAPHPQTHLLQHSIEPKPPHIVANTKARDEPGPWGIRSIPKARG
jgi:hypothetical protein